MTRSTPPNIHPTAVVEASAQIGNGTNIWHHAHIRAGAVVGDDCNIGKNVYVDSDAIVGSGVKIQNNVSVYGGVTIENLVFVGPSAVFTNDRFPRAFIDEFEMVPTLVREGASIGANATIVCGTTVGRYATVAAGSVVTHDVDDHGLVVGNPARHRGWMCRCGRLVSRDDIPPPDLDRCAGCFSEETP